MSDFVTTLRNRLVKEKGLAESTADAYIRNLVSLNGKQTPKNLAWLKKVDEINKRIREGYSESTQRTLLASIVSILSLAGPSYKKALSLYGGLMGTAVAEQRAKPSGVKTEKQELNWVPWNDIVTKHKELLDSTSSFKTKKALSEPEYNKLLELMTLSLYVQAPPRRNADYQLMWVTKNPSDLKDTTKNWLDLTNKHFVFNIYKTVKKYGQQVEEVPNDLFSTITAYLKHHPGKAVLGSKKAGSPIPLLTFMDGGGFKVGNIITRLLNKIIGKKVGASMLRHSYLTAKYGDVDKERKEDSIAMGHSLTQQSEYILN